MQRCKNKAELKDEPDECADCMVEAKVKEKEMSPEDLERSIKATMKVHLKIKCSSESELKRKDSSTRLETPKSDSDRNPCNLATYEGVQYAITKLMEKLSKESS